MSVFCVKYYHSFHSIEKKWKSLFDELKTSSFVAFEWHKVVLELYHGTFLFRLTNKIHYFTFSFEKEDEIDLIGFFLVTKHKGKKIIKFSPIIGPSDYFNFVLNENFNFDYIKKIIEQIALDYSVNEIHFAHIQKDTLLGKVIQSFTNKEIYTLDCVAISLPDNYDNYFTSLSKSVRQNIRTAYNRLKKNEFEFDFQLYTSADVHLIDFKELKTLYDKRNSHRKHKSNWKSVLYRKLNYPFGKEKDMFELRTLKDTDFTLGVLRIDNKIAAYFFGFEKKHKIEINRVVINNDFQFYSPGLILLNEYIKLSIPLGLKFLDLTVGNEKYKYDLGGTTHQILNAKINL